MSASFWRWEWPPDRGVLLIALIALLVLFAGLRLRHQHHRRAPASPAEPPVLWITPVDPLSLHACYSNLLITGQVGSAKTTGVGANLALGLLAHPSRPAFLVLCQKPDEAARWVGYARQAARLDAILHVRLGGEQRLDILRHELAVKGGGVESAGVLLDVILEVANRNRQRNSGDSYWPESSGRQMRCAMTLVQMGLGYCTLEHVLEFCQSLPTSMEELRDPEFAKRSFAAACVLKAALQHKDSRAFQMAAGYLSEWANLSTRTSSVIQSVTLNTLHKLLGGEFATLIASGESTFMPEQAMEEGKVVLLDLPGSVYGHPAQWAQIAIKLLFQKAAMRRDLSKPCRPLVLWADEAANFCVPEIDAMFLSQGRQFYTSCVHIVQNLPLVYTALGGNEAARHQAHAWISNHATVFCAANSDPETNGHFSALYGEEQEQLFGGSTGGGQNYDPAADIFGLPQGDVQVSWNTQYRPCVPPDRFAILAKGSAACGYIMQAWVHQSGRIFKASGKPFVKASFIQRFNDA